MEPDQHVEHWTLEQIESFTSSGEIYEASSSKLRNIYCFLLSFVPCPAVDELKAACLVHLAEAERREHLQDVKGSRVTRFLRWFNT
jgi:hypothetical protein